MSHTTPDTNGGTFIASLREKTQLTQFQLAERAGISRSMVAQIEIGQRRPSRKMLHAICQALKASAEDEQQLLLFYEFTPSGETPERIAAFLRADKSLSAEQATQLAEIIREAYKKALKD